MSNREMTERVKTVVAEAQPTPGRGRDGRFPPKSSGNPAGRPKGSRNKTTLAAQALLDGEAEALTRKAIELAMSGDPVALRLCLERILPRREDRLVELSLAKPETTAEVASGLATVIHAVGAGMLTPSEGEKIARILETQGRLLEKAKPGQRMGRGPVESDVEHAHEKLIQHMQRLAASKKRLKDRSRRKDEALPKFAKLC